MIETTTLALTEEQTLLLDTIRKFAQDSVAPGAAGRDLNPTFPEDVIQEIAGLGLLGLPYPETIGGAEMDHFTYVLVLEELARVCGSTAMTVLVHTSLALGTVFHAGSPEQHERWGAPLAAGDPLGALVLGAHELAPGPLPGTVTAIRGDGCWVLNGAVDQVMNGSRAGTLVVLGATDLDSSGAGLFLVNGDASGLTRGQPIHTMGLRAMDHAAVTFHDVKVADQDVLGDPAGGLTLVERALDHARAAIGAVEVGLARSALKAAASFASERILFGKPLATFTGSREKFANLAASLEGARQLVYTAARALDASDANTDMAIAAQLQAGSMASDVAFEALQLMGGYGYCHEYDVERICRDAKMCEVGFDELVFVRRRLSRNIVGA